MANLLLLHLQGSQHPRRHREAGLEGVDGIKGTFLVFLHVGVIGQGEALHDGEEAEEAPVDPAGLAPEDLGHVRVLLLGHDA